MFITTAAIYSLGHGLRTCIPTLRTFIAVRRSTQPSTLRGTVNEYQLNSNSNRLILTNGDGECGWQQPIFGGLTAQVKRLSLSVGGHPTLSLHSSNEPGELSQWL